MTLPTKMMDPRPDTLIDWWALLAPTALPTPTPGVNITSYDCARVLDRPYEFGGVRLVPADHQITEYVPEFEAGGRSTWVSWPVFITGQVETVSGESEWWTISRSAPEVHRAACLLSLAWFEAWRVRIVPTLTGSIPPSVPEFPNLSPWPDDNPQIGMREEAVLPTWFGPAWERVSASPDTDPLPSALTSWHQGMLLWIQHASFALMAFVATIEALGSSPELSSQVGPPPEACPTCGHVPHAAKRFWAAVELVASVEDLAILQDAKAYDLRSKTGHRAITHGFESRFGARLSLPVSKTDEAGQFVGTTLGAVARVGRDLLLRVLA
jgi:hypothetical protein